MTVVTTNPGFLQAKNNPSSRNHFHSNMEKRHTRQLLKGLVNSYRWTQRHHHPCCLSTNTKHQEPTGTKEPTGYKAATTQESRI